MKWIALAIWSIWFRHPIQQQQSQQWQAGPIDKFKSARDWLTEYRRIQEEKRPWNPTLTKADIKFHRRLMLQTPSKVPESLLFIKKLWSWEDVLSLSLNLESGGFIFIQGNRLSRKPFQTGTPEAMRWFLLNGWKLNDSIWRDFDIYKKPYSRGGLFLLQSS